MPNMYRNMRFDTVRDLYPIVQVAESAPILAIHPSVPAKSVQELIALAKAQPGKITAAASGIGSTNHLTTEMFKSMAKIDLLIVPYKGGAPAMAAVIAGESQMMISGPATVQANIKAGKLKAIAVTTAKRSPGMPDVPTFQESGVPGFDTYEWYGMFAPAGIPKAALEKLNRDIAAVVKIPEVSARMNGMGCIPTTNTPQAFAAFVKSEMEKWGTLAKKVNLQPN